MIRGETETRKTIGKQTNEPKSCFPEKNLLMDKYLARLRKKEYTNQIKNERRDNSGITTDTTDPKWLLRTIITNWKT